jgi:O-antigen ligase
MGRVEAWAAGMDMLMAHPFSGVGKEQFVEHHERDSHSSYVRVGAETGIVGLFLFSGMLLSAFTALKQSRSTADDDTSKLYGAGFVGCLGAYLLASIFSSRGYDTVFLVMLALLGGWTRLRLAEHNEAALAVPHLRVLVTTCAILATWKVFLIQTW